MEKQHSIIKMDSGFAQIPNELINNSSLSAKARFFYCYLMAKPNDWKFYNNKIIADTGIKIDTLRKCANELIGLGWVVKIQDKNEDGTFGGNKFIINSYPYQYQKSRCLKNSATVKSVTEKIRDGKNQAHNNTNFNTNKENNNKKEQKDLFGNDAKGVSFLPVDVLNYLNLRLKEKSPTRRGYGATDSNLKNIKSILRSKKVKYNLSDFKGVIDFKMSEWWGEEKTRKWIRPSTLFGDKFDQYLTEASESETKTDWGNNNFVEGASCENDLL